MNLLTIPFCLTISILMSMSTSVLADSDKDREINKLKKRDVEALSLQELTDIYAGCLSASYTTEVEKATSVDEYEKATLGPVDQKAVFSNCVKERELLGQKMSDTAIDRIDEDLQLRMEQQLEQDRNVL